MSEYKTYKCDICGKLGAIHFSVPCVDRIPDASGNSDTDIEGDIDLCEQHVDRLLKVALALIPQTMEFRRRLWKGVLGK